MSNPEMPQARMSVVSSQDVLQLAWQPWAGLYKLTVAQARRIPREQQGARCNHLPSFVPSSEQLKHNYTLLWLRWFDTQLSATLSTAESAPPDYRRNPAEAAFWQQLLPMQLFPCTSFPPPSTHCRTKSLNTVHTGKKHNYTHIHNILSPS